MNVDKLFRPIIDKILAQLISILEEGLDIKTINERQYGIYTAFATYFAAEELAEQGPHAVDDLLYLVRSKTGPQLFAIILALGKTRDVRALDVLLAFAKDKHDVEARIFAIQALGYLGDPRARSHLEEILVENGDTDLRVTVLQAIAELPGEGNTVLLTEVFKDPDAEVRSAAIAALASAPAGSVPREVFIQALRDRDKDVCQTAIRYLAEHADDSLGKVMIRALQCEHRSVAKAAANWLEPHIDKFLPELCEQLNAKGPYVRKFSVQLLRKSKDPQMIGPLGEALRTARGHEQSEDIVNCLIRFRTAEVGHALGRAIRDNVNARYLALKAILKTRSREAVPYIEELLDQCEDQSRIPVYMTAPLAAVGDAEAKSLLVKLLSRDSVEVRACAAEALASIKAVDMLDAVESSYTTAPPTETTAAGDEIQLKFDRALATLRALSEKTRKKPGTVKQLQASDAITLLSSSDAGVRTDALNSLDNATIRENFKRVLKLLSDEKIMVRQAATAAIIRLNNPAVVDDVVNELLASHSSYWVRPDVIDAMLPLLEARHAGKLLSYLDDCREPIMRSIERALKKIGFAENRIQALILDSSIKRFLRDDDVAEIKALGNTAIPGLRELATTFESEYCTRAAAMLCALKWEPQCIEEETVCFLAKSSEPDYRKLTSAMLPIVERLFRCDSSYHHRDRLYEAVKHYGEQFKPCLLAILQDETREFVQSTAAEFLARLTSTSAQELASFLKHCRAEVRRRVAIELRERDLKVATEMLIDALQREEPGNGANNMEAASEMARALGAFRSKAAVPALAAALSKNVESAANALAAIGGAEAKFALITSFRTRPHWNVAECLVEIGWQPSDVSEQATLYAAANKWDRVAMLGSPAIVPVGKWLAQGGHYTDRIVDFLRDVRDESAIPLLSTILKSSSSGAAIITAREALVTYGEATVSSFLAIEDWNHEHFATEAARILAELKSPRSEDLQLHLLSHSSRTVRRIAITGLARLKSRKALPQLIDCLRSDKYDLIRAAVEAIGAINDPAALEALQNTKYRGDKKLEILFDKVIAKLEKTAMKTAGAKKKS